MNKEVRTAYAPQPIGPYPQAVLSGNILFASGALGADPISGDLKEGIEAQSHQALENLKAILAGENFGLCDVVKTTVYLNDMNDFATFNAIYAEYFNGVYPARTCVEVSKLPKGGLVEIEAIAVK